jgi:hypothetical protein
MKAYGGVDVQNQVFLTSVLLGGEWSPSSSGRFTSGQDLRYPLDRMLGEPQSRSGLHAEMKIITHTGYSNSGFLDHPTLSQSLYRLCYPLKNSVISSRIEPATFRLVVQCLNQQRYRVPPRFAVTVFKRGTHFDILLMYQTRKLMNTWAFYRIIAPLHWVKSPCACFIKKCSFCGIIRLYSRNYYYVDYYENGKLVSTQLTGKLSLLWHINHLHKPNCHFCKLQVSLRSSPQIKQFGLWPPHEDQHAFSFSTVNITGICPIVT